MSYARHRPDKLPRLRLALEHSGARFVDMALEVPGLIYYSSSRFSDGRAPVRDFFPSMHRHGGCTWKWYNSPSEVRRRCLAETYKLPSGLSVRSLAERIATRHRQTTSSEVKALKVCFPCLGLASGYGLLSGPAWHTYGPDKCVPAAGAPGQAGQPVPYTAPLGIRGCVQWAPVNRRWVGSRHQGVCSNAAGRLQ